MCSATAQQGGFPFQTQKRVIKKDIFLQKMVKTLWEMVKRGVSIPLLRGNIGNRTTENYTFIYCILTNDFWSYLLWSPVILSSAKQEGGGRTGSRDAWAGLNLPEMPIIARWVKTPTVHAEHVYTFFFSFSVKSVCGHRDAGRSETIPPCL